jgi:hypothetical protein
VNNNNGGGGGSSSSISSDEKNNVNSNNKESNSSSTSKNEDQMPMDNHLSIVDHLNSKIQDYKCRILSLTLQSHLQNQKNLKSKAFRSWEQITLHEKIKSEKARADLKSREISDMEIREKEFLSKLKDERHGSLIEKAKLKSENKKLKTEVEQSKLTVRTIMSQENSRVANQHEIGVGTSIDFSKINRINNVLDDDNNNGNYSDASSDNNDSNDNNNLSHWLHNVSGTEADLIDLVESDVLSRRNTAMLPKSRQDIAASLAADIMTKLQKRHL